MSDSQTTPVAPRLFLPQLLNETFNDMMGQLHEHLVSCGYDDLRPTHFMNVFRFMDCDGTRPAELARRAGMTPQSMGDLVAHLEKRGYIKRVGDQSDRRVRVVVWAERGRTAADTANAFFQRLEQRWVTEVGEDYMELLKHALTKLVRQPVT